MRIHRRNTSDTMPMTPNTMSRANIDVDGTEPLGPNDLERQA